MTLQKASSIQNSPKLRNLLYLGAFAACICHTILAVARSNITVIFSLPHSDAVALALFKVSATTEKMVEEKFI